MNTLIKKIGISLSVILLIILVYIVARNYMDNESMSSGSPIISTSTGTSNIPSVTSGVISVATTTNEVTHDPLPKTDSLSSIAKVNPSVDDLIESPALYLPEAQDFDLDGLPDLVEASYKTDKASNDTDKDGVGDFREIMIYYSNPINPDTDNDGFKDGEEVLKKFNPCGNGRLPEAAVLAKACAQYGK
jgi:hypothetical protein